MPTIDCEQPATADIPAAPKEWGEEMAVWIRGLLGTVAEERSLRKVEHDCLQKHRDAGIIR